MAMHWTNILRNSGAAQPRLGTDPEAYLDEIRTWFHSGHIRPDPDQVPEHLRRDVGLPGPSTSYEGSDGRDRRLDDGGEALRKYLW